MNNKIMNIALRQMPKVSYVEVEGKSSDLYTKWGANNLFPNTLLGYYEQSALLHSIIDGMVQYICGSGFTDESLNKKIVNKRGETLELIVKKCTADYLILGNFALNVLHNQKGQVSEIYWLDMTKIRVNADYAFYNKDWSKSTKGKITKLNDVDSNNAIWVFKNPMSRSHYGLPIFSAAYREIETSIEISNYHLNNIINNFTPSAIVNFKGAEPSDEEKKEIQRALENKFTGTDNASRLMLTWYDADDSAVTINSFGGDNFQDKYNALQESTTNAIYAALRATPTLFGGLADRTGFNSLEYRESFKLYNTTVIAPIQREIENAFRSIVDANGNTYYDFELESFSIDFEEGGDNE